MRLSCRISSINNIKRSKQEPVYESGFFFIGLAVEWVVRETFAVEINYKKGAVYVLRSCFLKPPVYPSSAAVS